MQNGWRLVGDDWVEVFACKDALYAAAPATIAGRMEVRGLGVVGHQPLLKPGERFEYTSWTRLDTPHGVMQGTYFCMTDAAEAFEAPIPAFTLARQQSLH